MNNSLYYEYKGLDLLSRNVDGNIPEIKTVYICGFYVNLSGFYPFLQYLLHIQPDGLLGFPSFDVSCIVKDTSQLIEIANDRIVELFSANGTTIDIKSTRCCGFKVRHNCIYIFYDFMNLKIELNSSLDEQKLWFCLMDEIVNTLAVCDRKVSSNTTYFLLNCPEFVFLNDKNNSRYEIPSVVYVHCDANKMHMVYTFGQTKADETAILGAGYYFTSFLNTPLQRTKYGIVRFAFFAGVMLVKQNLPFDSVDESAIKCDIMKNTSSECRLTNRVSDHSGTWACNYDSVYLGQVELDDGTILRDAPFIVAKDRARHIPLSYHQFANRKI